MKEMLKNLRHNHGLMMLVCCGVPLVLLAVAVYFFGLDKSYLVWLIILLCPITHLFMMRDAHKESGKKSKRNKYG